MWIYCPQNNANNFTITDLQNVNYSAVKIYIKIKQDGTLKEGRLEEETLPNMLS